MSIDFESLASELEELDKSPATILPEAVLSPQDWEDYYQEVERIKAAMELGPGAGRIVLKAAKIGK